MKTTKQLGTEFKAGKLANLTPSPPSDGGEGRGEDERSCWIAPLLDPLPTRSSRGEEEKTTKSCLRVVLPFLAIALGMLLLTRHANAEKVTINFSHDGQGRLTEADYGSARIVYVYDPAGNLLRRTVEAFVDSDNDGMDDNWELTHFMTLDRDGTKDKDLDGLSDLAEFLAGTIPTDDTSLLILLPDPNVARQGVTVQWQSITGKTYRILYKDDLAATTWTVLPGNVTATGPTASKLDPTASQDGNRYYRVELAQ